MKNNVVRWSATNNQNDKINNYSERHFNFFQGLGYVVAVPETPLPLPQAAQLHDRAANTEIKTEPRDRPLASAASNCDTNKYKFNNKKNFLLVHKNVSGVQSKKSRRSCATDLVVRVIQCAPYFAANASSSNATHAPTNVPSGLAQPSDLMRRPVCRSFGLTKFHLLCVQVCCLVFFSSINVGVAVSINSSRAGNEHPSDGLNYFEADDAVLDNESARQYTHTWAVHIPNGDIGLADNVARDHGFVNLGKIFDDHYHFAHHRVSKRSLLPSSRHQTRLEKDERVNWATQQIVKSRRKRDFIRMRPSRTSSRAVSLVDAVSLSDPKWSQMWYLNRGGGLDMNVIPAWKEGITGKGIVVTILDDGLESDHPDIEHNYDPKASYDVNSHDDDPMPHYDMTDSNRHGTRCAGEVAATANNSICAVGIAYGASVGGVRMLDGDVTDAVEARSLSLNPQHIDIYSASWGPDDDGKTVDGPGELASRAFIEGVTKGRRGKGSIFIWASGNGGRELDNCNCDGYTNSIWTLSISSATEEGNVPWYSEKCSSTLATTYSSGGQSEKQVVTTDLHHSCTVSHTGTSASAPLAAGIAALVLESNQNLTWRDLQHIVVRTAKPANLRDPTWSKNGVGRRISHSFGYGLMDAAAMVRVARTWTMVPEQQRCEINAPHVDKVIPVKGYITLQLTVKHCLSVNYLEHVQAKITLTAQRRGDIQLYLKSPAGTKVTLLTSRNHDVSRSGFNQWPFMSVHTWGESPHGNWQLEIHNEGRYMGHAMLREWSLIFYGTTFPIEPNDPKSTPRVTTTEYTTPNSSSTATTTNLHQFYSEQYPRILSSNFGVIGGGVGILGGGKFSAKFPLNKAVFVAASPPIAASANIGNKKQQQQKQQIFHGISDTFEANTGPQNKSKIKNNGKGKTSETKGNKNNGNNGKSSTNKKDPTPTTTPKAKNKFYRLSNNKSNSKSQLATAAQRPKSTSFSNSNERLQSYEDKQSARKVVGDLVPIISGKTPTKNTSSQTTSYSKLPVKATKQIKENHSTIQSNEKLTSNDQRIPKMFERYEKIQAIFPEFQPYQGAKDDIEISANNRNLFQPHEAAIELVTELTSFSTSVRPFGFNGGSKPSRENSKKSSHSSSQEQRQQDIVKKQKQFLLPSGTADGVRNIEVADRHRQIVSADKGTTNKKSKNAQITQWDLIFHGTEIPAQPDDPVQISPGKLSPYGNDMDHNHLDFDPNSASGQWRNVEQVGESSLMSSDRTNTACLKATIDRKCLACAFPTFIYDGRCYQECPPHTFTRSIQTKETDKNSIILKNTEPNEELQSTERKRTARPTNYAADVMLTSIDAERGCSTCDRSCFRCYGPLSSQCSTCYPGSQLRKALLSNETYCYVFAERSSGNSRDGVASSATKIAKNGIWADIAMFLVIIVPALIVISVLVFLSTTLGKKLPWCYRRTNYTYDRVTLFSENEPEVECEVAETVVIETNYEHRQEDVVLRNLSDIDSDSDSNVYVYEPENPLA